MTKTKRNHTYGVASKYGFGHWMHVVYGPFRCEEDAQEWMNHETYDFWERELMSKTAAIKLAGRKNVERAVEPLYYSR